MRFRIAETEKKPFEGSGSIVRQWARISVLMFIAGWVASCGHAEPEKNVTESASVKEKYWQDGQTLELTLPQAINYALDHNLDARVAALQVLIAEDQIGLETLNAFPSLNLSGGVRGRSNNGASSSRSIESGQISLEPSTSADQIRRFYELQTRWNTVDLAMAVLQSKTAKDRAKIEALRTEKVLSNIQRDVVSAYLKTVDAQKNAAQIAHLEEDAAEVINSIQTASGNQLLTKKDAADDVENLTNLLKVINQQREQAQNTELELKSLLGVPAGTKLILKPESVPTPKIISDVLKQDIAKLETAALENRPELKEAKLTIDITDRQKRELIWQAVPGGEFVGTWNRDSNSFLEEADWFNFSASIAQNLINLFKLPATLRNAGNQKTLEETRYEALAVAVLFQVRLAHRQVLFANDMKRLAEKERTLTDKKFRTAEEQYKNGFLSKKEVVEARLQRQLKTMEHQRGLHDLYDAYLQMQSALGRSVFQGAERKT